MNVGRIMRQPGVRGRAAGAMVGAAIGDALGMPTEFVQRKLFVEQHHGKITGFTRASPGHPCSHLKPAQYTDDTQQLVILAESLLESKGLLLEDFGGRLAEWGRRCKFEPGFDRFAGFTSLTAAERLGRGVSPWRSGSRKTLSCGSAMRVAPIGIYYGEFGEALEMARRSSIPTHDSEIAKDAAAVVAGIINAIVHRSAGALEAVGAAAGGIRNRLLAGQIDWALRMRKRSPDFVARKLGTGSRADEAVAYAVYLFLHSPPDFEQTVLNAANVDSGDSDTIGCIAGAISGAYNGFEGIPGRFLEVEDAKYLRKLGEKLAARHSGLLSKLWAFIS